MRPVSRRARRSMTRPAFPGEPDIERQEAIEPGGLSPPRLERRGRPPVFEQPEPAQRPRHAACEHRALRVPVQTRHRIVATRGRRPERLRVLPLARHDRETPEDHAGIVLRPPARQPAGKRLDEFGEVGVPAEVPEQEGLEGAPSSGLQLLDAFRLQQRPDRLDAAGPHRHLRRRVCAAGRPSPSSAGSAASGGQPLFTASLSRFAASNDGDFEAGTGTLSPVR